MGDPSVMRLQIAGLAGRPAGLLERQQPARALLVVAVVAVLAALLLPVFEAPPAPLTSDESLYLSEGYNIAAGIGPKYTSQELVNHRAPLYPALLAIPLRLTGGEPDSAYWVSKIIVAGLVAAVFLTAWQLFDALAGVVAALLVGSSAFVRSFGSTLYLDGAQTLLLLLSLALIWRAADRRSARLSVVAGVLFGAAFLMKETAIQWLPLPLTFALISGRLDRASLRGVAAFTLASAAVMAVWWAWVYLATDRIYFWGRPDARLLVAAAGAGLLALAGGAAWLLVRQWAPARLRALAAFAGAALATAWVVLLFLFLELTSWPYPKEHLTTVPDYFWRIAAPNTALWPLVVAGVAWLCFRCRQEASARLLVLAVALFLPFALFVANREFAYRDLLPALCVGYVGAGGLSARVLRRVGEQGGVLVAGAIAAAIIGSVGWVQTRDLIAAQDQPGRSTVTERNWDNELVHSLAAWVHDNVPQRAGIMSSRLYFSHLYVLDEARHPIYQLPTVRIEPKPGEQPFLRRTTTLFRWEDHRLTPTMADERWLYVQRYPIKLYYIGLSEHDVLRDIRERSVDYLVLTGEDAGFSSFAYLDYFMRHPAFEPVYQDRRSPSNGAYVFRVDHTRLAPQQHRAAVDADTLLALSRSFGPAPPEQLAYAIDPDGIRPASGESDLR